MSNSSESPENKKVLVKRWKQTSGEWIYLVLAYVLPLVIGFAVWACTTSIKEALLWGVVSFVVDVYLIVPALTIPVFVGLDEAELRQVIGNFCKNAINESQIDVMAVGRRRFSLYCEITEAEKSFIGIKLPWKHWHDLYDDNMRKSLKEAGAANIIEAEKNIYAYGPRDTENALSLIYCLLDITETDLTDLAIVVVTTYAVPIFSDLPPKRQVPNDGIKKK